MSCLSSKLVRYSAILVLFVVFQSAGLRALPDFKWVKTTEEFNQLPREARLMYIKAAGNQLLSLGPNAKVDDLVDDVIAATEDVPTDGARINLGYALIAIANTDSRSENVVNAAKKMADELVAAGQSGPTGYEIYYHLLGSESRPILLGALRDNDSGTKVRIARRLGRYIGTMEDVAEMTAALEREENGGSKTVAKYLREAIAEIKKRESGEKPSKTLVASNSESPFKSSPSSTPEPTFAKKPPTPAKEPAGLEASDAEADSNPFPYWIFIIGGMVLAGLVVLLRRK